MFSIIGVGLEAGTAATTAPTEGAVPSDAGFQTPNGATTAVKKIARSVEWRVSASVTNTAESVFTGEALPPSSPPVSRNSNHKRVAAGSAWRDLGLV
jgi:hypothetical protein